MGQLARTQQALNLNRAARLGALRSERIQRVDDPHRSYQVETLTRAKYKLPEATAQALASFIQEHVKGDVEARVSGDTLTVIALQEDQARIDAFIGLLGESARPAAGEPLAPPKPNAPLDGPRDGQHRR